MADQDVTMSGLQGNPNTFKVVEIREGKSAGFNTSQYGKGLY